MCMGSMKTHLFVIVFCSLLLMGATSHDGTVHMVKSGDTLLKIAERYMPYTEAYTKKELIAGIKEMNMIAGPISPGQSLSIPVVWNQPLKPVTISKPADFSARGLYMTSYSAGSRFILESADRLRESGGNTLVFDAKDDIGAITYPSSIPGKYCPNARYRRNIEELPKMIEFLHRMDIHVVARVVAFKDPIMAKARPQWCINTEKNWLDPANLQVQDYVLEVIEELSNKGVDEIQLDYIRYPADKKTSTGIEGVLRTDVIAGFIEKVHDITRPKGVLLSVDMFGIIIWQRNVDMLSIGQDIAKIKPHVEIISPMLYPSHFSAGFDGVEKPADDPYRIVFGGIQKMKDLVGEDVVIRPWLQSFPLGVTKGFGPEYIQAQIDAVNDAGGTGWLLWSPGNHYSKAYAAMQTFPDQEQWARGVRIGTGLKNPVQPMPAEDVISAIQRYDPDLDPGKLL